MKTFGDGSGAVCESVGPHKYQEQSSDKKQYVHTILFLFACKDKHKGLSDKRIAWFLSRIDGRVFDSFIYESVVVKNTVVWVVYIKNILYVCSV